tara:strand:- start:2851 stop:3144 length:294 start_codon:yes stop_codon:yes gene_type:complete
MEIKQTEDTKKGAFTAYSDAIEAGKMTYTWAGNTKFIIDHTEVNPEFNGQGVGKKMVMEAVKMAREKKVKILPLCPFAKSVFDKTPEIGDVLFKNSN